MGIKKYIKNTNISKRYIQVSIIIFLIIIIGLVGTYAWFTWSSTNNTSVTLSIGELADVTYTTGPDIKVNNLSPVYNYTDGESTTFSITNKDTSGSSLRYTVSIDINKIDTPLVSKDFKYKLISGTNIISEGDFSTAIEGNSINLATSMLTDAKTNFTLYLYIDGNNENQTSMMNQSFTGKINVSVEEGTSIASYITNLYMSASGTDKSTVENNSITYLYDTKDNLMQDVAGNVRYYGASPNNYIYFNCSDYSNQTSDTCELWRIIGVFDGKLKIMRNESIGSYSWNSHYINEWSQATAMKLLNPGYESESVGGSLYYNSKSGKCYRDASNLSTDSSLTSCDFTSTGIKNEETRSKIAVVTWNLGGWSTSGIYSNQIYEYERGTTIYSGHSETWTGKVALPYPSDYGYAADFNSCGNTLYNYADSTCTGNNWMYPILSTNQWRGWLLTPNSGYGDRTWYVNEAGYVRYYDDYYAAFNAYGITPTLYLSSGEFIVEGTEGTESNPYKLQ